MDVRGAADAYVRTAMASTRTEIDSISLDVESNIEAGDSSGDVDVTCDSGDYYVDDIEITNEPKMDGMTAISQS